jgi:membrane-bound ClpP family serine protease
MQVFLLSIAIVLGAGLSGIALLSRWKKSQLDTSPILGANAVALSPLTPEGSVLVDGEVWRAVSSDGTAIQIESDLVVTAVRRHLLLVQLR